MPQSTSKKYPWDEIFAKDGRVFTELLPIFHEAALKFSENQTRNILDLGCGNGRHVIAFQQLGYDVVGFDRSPIGLRITLEWLDEEGQSTSLVEGDGRFALPFQTDVFDGLISTQVIHHALLSEIRQTISEIWRVMATGGLAVISVAGRTHQDTAYEKIEPGTFVPLDGSEAGLPHHIFTKDELCQEFSTFKVQEISYRDNGRVLVIWIKKT